MAVIIVESPAKARKIQGFFTDGTKCISSCGHIRDLQGKTLSIDISNNFEPDYVICEDKKKIASRIRASSKTHEIILAADDDREGHAIAWHCGRVAGVDFTKKNRITFNEISKKAIKQALEDIHPINMNEVDAQQARRIIDRLVGFSLSPLLWKHIKTSYKGLSAGRVQSTLLNLLQDKSEQIKTHTPTIHSKCQGVFEMNDISWKGTFSETTCEPETLLGVFRDNRVFTIESQNHYIDTEYSPAPLITSSLQIAAQRELDYSIQTCMKIAQKLYENGKITYMRTDSPVISPDFQQTVKQYIKQEWSLQYYQEKKGRKSKGAQEAHECIRVTKLDETLNDRYTKEDVDLYELIKRYTILSQMKPALYDVTKITLTTKDSHQYGTFTLTYRTLSFQGYFIYYQGTTKEHRLQTHLTIPDESIFTLQTSSIIYEPKKCPSYYDESSIVTLLETSGIGRPSTYVSIINTLYNRHYTLTKTIEPEEYNSHIYDLSRSDKITDITKKKHWPRQDNKIVLTELGETVLTYLRSHFSHIITTEFTSQVESDLDEIAKGMLEWRSVIKKVYDSFITEVRVQSEICSQSTENTKYIKPTPRKLGEYNESPVILKSGPYGLYVFHNNTNRSLKYTLQDSKKPYEAITLEDIIDAIKYPYKVGSYKRSDIMIHNGPHGIYMKYNSRNYRISHDEKITLEDCISCINANPKTT